MRDAGVAVAKLGCRPGDKMDAALIADSTAPRDVQAAETGTTDPRARHKTTRNHVTAWWDASQIYGYDERSERRVKRDPADRAKLRHAAKSHRRRDGYLPVFGKRVPAGATTDSAIRFSPNGRARKRRPFRITGRSA